MVQIKKFSQNIFLIALITMTLVFDPFISLAVTMEKDDGGSKKLFKTIDKIKINEEIIINEDTLFYGELQNEYVVVQFANSYLKISSDLVEDVDFLEKKPEYHDFNDDNTFKK